FRSSISLFITSFAFPVPLNSDQSYAGDEDDEFLGNSASRRLSSQNP
ncbi:hypothetical protein A2U01_0043143, partial [Trifolium medium]|nr:hypothetical protein [Trifolium medium]